MIKFENKNGYIEITNEYFEKLVGQTAQSCFGVTGMVTSGAIEGIKSIIFKNDSDNLDRGVQVKSVNGALQVDLHIAVSYGVNINTIADSITNKVRYTVETATDLKVSDVNVFIDAIS